MHELSRLFLLMLHNTGVNFGISEVNFLGFSLGDTCQSTRVNFSLHLKTYVKALLSFLLV